MEAALIGILLGLVLPLWLIAGLLDWWCHRRADIEHTSGLKESRLHLLMLAQVGAGVLAVLLLRINALVLMVLALLWLLHQITSAWDSAWASPRRHISVLEQHVHGFLDVLPLTALLLLGILHQDQLRPLFGAAGADFSLAWKDPAPLWNLAAAVVGVALLMAVLPFGEEWWRTRRAARHHSRRPIDAGHSRCPPTPPAC